LIDPEFTGVSPDDQKVTRIIKVIFHKKQIYFSNARPEKKKRTTKTFVFGSVRACIVQAGFRNYWMVLLLGSYRQGNELRRDQ
jgi:hypothetical protein